MRKFILIFTLMFTSACATTPDLPAPRVTMKDVNAPEWVIKASGAFDKTKAFHGVGSANDIKNSTLQRMAADDRARNDLAKNFQFYTESLMKDYMAHTTAEDFSNTSEEQNVEVAIKTITSISLSGVLIVDHWENPYKNEIFSLAELDIDKFKQNIDSYKNLPEHLRENIKNRADKLHKELTNNVERIQ